DELAAYQPWSIPLLEKELANPAARPDRRLHARLALLRTDQSHVPAVREALLTADAQEFPVLRDALFPVRDPLTHGLWQVLENYRGSAGQAFRAAAALAHYDAGSPRWPTHVRFVAEQLIAQPALTLPVWVQALRPLKDQLLPSLAAILREQA